MFPAFQTNGILFEYSLVAIRKHVSINRHAIRHCTCHCMSLHAQRVSVKNCKKNSKKLKLINQLKSSSANFDTHYSHGALAAIEFKTRC